MQEETISPYLVRAIVDYLNRLLDVMSINSSVRINEHYRAIAKNLELDFEQVKDIGTAFAETRADIEVKRGPFGGWKKLSLSTCKIEPVCNSKENIMNDSIQENLIDNVVVITNNLKELCDNLQPNDERVMITAYYKKLAHAMGLKFEEVRTIGSMYVADRADIKVSRGRNGGMQKLATSKEAASI